jgi:hypothetical protein
VLTRRKVDENERLAMRNGTSEKASNYEDKINS